MKEYTMTNNAQFNSLEIYFNDKPDAATRDALKRLKFRWHAGKKCWYGYETEEAARAAIEGQPAQDAPKAIKAAKTDPAPQNHIKIYYNGIKIDGGQLIKCFYSLNNNSENADSVSISARNYERLPRDLLPVTNETDIYTDYFDNDRAYLTPAHPLYKYFRYAAIKAEIKDYTRYIDKYNKELARPERWHGRHEQLKKDIEKYRAKLAELEKETDPGQPTAADLAEIDRQRQEAENRRREEEHKRELEERERVLAERAAGKEYINAIAAQYPIKDGAPVVYIPFSENPAFYSFMVEDQKTITLHADGTQTEEITQKMPRCVLSVTAADIVLNHFDKIEAAKACGYDKTDFIITWNDADGEPGQYKGRYDLGDNDGGLIEHIRSFGEWSRTHDAFGKIKDTPDDTNDNLEIAAYLAQFKAV